MFKIENKLSSAFCLKYRIGVVDKFQCGLYNESYFGECLRNIKVKIREHIGISPMTKKAVKSKGSVVSDHLLVSSHSPSFESFRVQTKENKKLVF